MSIKRISDWRKLPVTLAELCIDTTLRCGQSFRWRKINDEWYVVSHLIPFNLIIVSTEAKIHVYMQDLHFAWAHLIAKTRPDSLTL